MAWFLFSHIACVLSTHTCADADLLSAAQSAVFSGLFLRQTSGDSAQITRPGEKFTVAEPDRWLAGGAAGAQIFTPQVDEATVSALVFSDAGVALAVVVCIACRLRIFRKRTLKKWRSSH